MLEGKCLYFSNYHIERKGDVCLFFVSCFSVMCIAWCIIIWGPETSSQDKQKMSFGNRFLSFKNELMWSSSLGAHLVCISSLKWNHEKRKTTFRRNFVFVTIYRKWIVKNHLFSIISSVPTSVGGKVLSWLLTQLVSFFVENIISHKCAA